MTTIKQVLDQKGHDVHCIHPDASVFDALKMMAENNIGSLVVLENGKLVGLIAERHYAREIVLKGRTSPGTSGKFGAPIAGVSPVQDKLQLFQGGHDADEISRRLFCLSSTRLRYRRRGLYGRGAGAEGKSHHRPGPLDCLEGSSRHDH